MHKLNELQPSGQRSTKRNATHTHNGARNSQAPLCYRCGGKHSASKCRFKTELCHVCGKVGHISRVCHNVPQFATRGQGHTTNLVENQPTEPDTFSQNPEYTLFPIKPQAATPPWQTALTINGIQVEMETDTRASLSYQQSHI